MAWHEYDQEVDDVLGHALALASSLTLPHHQRYSVPGGGRLVSTPPSMRRPSAPPPTRLPHGDVLDEASRLFNALDTVSPSAFRRRLSAVTRSSARQPAP